MRLPQGTELQFLAEAGLRNAELITIFGNGTTGHFIALFRHSIHQFIVCERLMLVLIVDTFLKSLLEFSGRHLLAILIFKTFRKEIFKGIDTEMGFDILAVHDS